MTIATKLQIATIAALVMVAGVAALLSVSLRRLDRTISQYELADRLAQGLFELDAVTGEYLLRHGERPGAQWKQRHASLAPLIAGLSCPSLERYHGLVQTHRDMGRAFAALAGLYDQPGAPDVFAEREAALLAQLVAHEKRLIDMTSELKSDERAALLRAQRAQSALTMAATVGVAAMIVFGAVLLQISVVRPIKRLQSGLESVGRGRLDHRVGWDTPDEIGDVSRAFDRMAQNLRAITASRDDLNREIGERQRAENRLARTNDELRRRAAELSVANRELEAFAYSVSHDLRAPLRSIDGFSQALLEDYGAALDGKGSEYLARVRAATQRMGDLIDALLLLSRVTRAEMSIQPVDLADVAGTIADDLRLREPGRAVEVVITRPAPASGDPRLLAIALTNLTDNAWKFTSRRDRARVEFGQHADGSGTVFYVRDNGVGFDMQYADKLFGAFQRLHADTDFHGTGIGLATVHRIIERHGGRVWAESQPGVGTTFFFSL